MWTLNPSERLRWWQNFRNQINTASKEEAINQTQHLWCYAPYVAHYLTTDKLSEWPGPWELVYENYYCDLAKSLGMLYTLYLSSHKPDLEIRIYNNPSTTDVHNLVWIDKGKYVVNYIHDEVVNKTQLDQAFKLKKTITVQDLGLDKL